MKVLVQCIAWMVLVHAVPTTLTPPSTAETAEPIHAKQINFVCHGKPVKAAEGQTLGSLAPSFGCSTDEVVDRNPHLGSSALTTGDEVCGPVQTGLCSQPDYDAQKYKQDRSLEMMELVQWQPETVMVIPKPQEVRMGEGHFELNTDTTIHAIAEWSTAAEKLSDFILSSAKLTLDIKDGLPPCNSIVFHKNDTITNVEGYFIRVSTCHIAIHAISKRGALHAVQTIRQLIPVALSHNTAITRRIPQLEIEDWPVYEWRGIMLDVSRHFFTDNEVKHVIDLLAMHKFNRLHWHLTDDHGWRLPVASHPEITKDGSWRNSEGLEEVGVEYGGSYSELEIMSVVLYAEQNGIEVIPEVDMPGHSQTLLISHPEVGNNVQDEVRAMEEWGVSEYTLDPTRNATFTLISDVVHSLAELFPSEYIHVGGDEADHRQWGDNEAVRHLMEDLKIDNLDELQSFFEGRLDTILRSHGKRLVGWDEMIRGGAPNGSVIMSWEGMHPGVQAASDGHQVVMCPMEHAYFDRKYSPDDEHGRLGVMPLRDTYEWDPREAPGLDENSAKNIIGGQGNIWTEGMVTMEDVEYLSVPRMSALSEVLWTEVGKRDYTDFRTRLLGMSRRMENMDIVYPITV